MESVVTIFPLSLSLFLCLAWCTRWSYKLPGKEFLFKGRDSLSISINRCFTSCGVSFTLHPFIPTHTHSRLRRYIKKIKKNKYYTIREKLGVVLSCYEIYYYYSSSFFSLPWVFLVAMKFCKCFMLALPPVLFVLCMYLIF